MRIYLSDRRQFIKKNVGLCALLTKNYVHIAHRDVFNDGICFSTHKNTGFCLQVHGIHGDVFDGSRKDLGLVAVGCIDKNRLAYAPPPCRTFGTVYCICIFEHVPGNMVDINIRNFSTVASPDTNAAGAVFHHAITDDDIADVSMSLCPDFYPGISGGKDTIADYDIFTGTVFLSH